MTRNNIIPFTNAPARAPVQSAPPAPAVTYDDFYRSDGQPRIPTHRQAGVAPPYREWLDPADMARATRDSEMEAAISARLNRAVHRVVRPSLWARVADLAASEVGFAFFIGAYAGALLTAALAYAWSAVLS